MNPDLPTHNAIGIVVDTGREWLLQVRDNKDGILWPGKISLWGGSMEPADGGDFTKSALRELKEELELDASELELTVIGDFAAPHQSMKGELRNVHAKLFLAKLKEPQALHVYEGRGMYKVNYDTTLSELATEELTPDAYNAIEILSARSRA